VTPKGRNRKTTRPHGAKEIDMNEEFKANEERYYPDGWTYMCPQGCNADYDIHYFADGEWIESCNRCGSEMTEMMT